MEDVGIGWNERGLSTDHVPLVQIVSVSWHWRARFLTSNASGAGSVAEHGLDELSEGGKYEKRWWEEGNVPSADGEKA